jgi:tRNA-5-methyluridine54 2-sulfurtransferase
MNYVEQKALKTIKQYSLISKKDTIIVAVSGGKDSTVLLDILSKHFSGQLIALHLDVHIPKYGTENLHNISCFCKEKNIPLHVIKLKEEVGYTLSGIRKKLLSEGLNLTYCNICGTLKRYFLNIKGKELGATKIATGHNIDDMSQSFLMNQFRGNISRSFGLRPISGIDLCDSFVPRIKPLFFVKEEDIEAYSKESSFPVVYSSCPYAKESFRNYLKDHFNEYLKKNILFRKHIVSYYLDIFPKFSRKDTRKFSYCSLCAEPSGKKVCNACSLIERLKI